jgi:hypothetical protein
MRWSDFTGLDLVVNSSNHGLAAAIPGPYAQIYRQEKCRSFGRDLSRHKAEAGDVIVTDIRTAATIASRIGAAFPTGSGMVRTPIPLSMRREGALS